MQIKEVQEKLKISSYTLRYYEKMGLIQPYRDENGYRNYNEEDIHKIERIMFLRDINVPIEDIKDILDNKVTFQDVLENHIEKVNTEIESLQYIKNMCEDLKEKNIPLLDQVIEDNQIGDKKVKKRDLKKVFDYFKKDQTVIIGTRVTIRDIVSSIPIAIFLSVIIGFLVVVGIPNMIASINKQFSNTSNDLYIPIFKPSGFTLAIGIILGFILLEIIMILCNAKQNYIKFVDNHISICSYHYQKRVSILKSMILKKESKHNIKYTWDELDKVEIKLYFENKSTGRSGIKTFYVPEFSFYFKDGFKYCVDAWVSMEDSPKIAYRILRNKNIDIQASDEVIDFFEQNELKLYDFFENIYHKNGKNR